MDTSNKYIKMCEKAIEIQKIWKPTGGDWLVLDYRGTTKINRDFEKQIWGDDDKTWKRIEILCYQPSELKDWWVSSTREKSIVKSAQDLTKSHCVWLPRQDQLQEMIGGNIKDQWKSLIEFAGYMQDEYEWIKPEFKKYSWEQLWLAFVMKEKYNKIWSRSEWGQADK